MASLSAPPVTGTVPILLTAAPYHLLTYSTFFGMSFFHSFISSTVAYRTLELPSFAKLQGKIFPIYFGLQSALSIILVATYRDPSSSSLPLSVVSRITTLPTATLITLMIPLVSSLLNTTWLGPRTRSAKAEMVKMADASAENSTEDASDGYIKRRALFRRYHGASSAFNLVTILALGWYGISDLARRI